MRSTRPDLDSVLAEFNAWRAKPRGRRIPDRLWTAALELRDRYASSTICRHLRLNPARFKQVREVRDVASGARRPRRQRRGGDTEGWAPRPGLRLRAAPRRVSVAPRRDTFVELPLLTGACGGGPSAPTGCAVPRGTAGWRLILESGAGTLTLVTATPSHGLVDAVCRVVLGALRNGSRS